MRSALGKASPFLPALAVAALFVYARIADPFSHGEIFCFVNRVSGIRCATCGLTRALFCLLKGDPVGAFYYHALFTVGLLSAFLLSTAYLVNFACGRRVLPLPRLRWTYFYILLALLVLFLVVRNCTDYIY